MNIVSKEYSINCILTLKRGGKGATLRPLFTQSVLWVNKPCFSSHFFYEAFPEQARGNFSSHQQLCIQIGNKGKLKSNMAFNICLETGICPTL